jgi:hypothetical protein
MSVRFTTGGVGRFGFDEANATLDAADAMVGRFSDHGKHLSPEASRPIVARLTQDLGDIEFDQSPTGYRFRLWNWEQVNVTQSGARRAVVIQNKGRKSVLFGDYPRGRAIQISNSSQVGDHVVLFRLMQNTGFQFYAFAGTRPALTQATSLLKIDGEPELIDAKSKQWKYTVIPQYWDGTFRTDVPEGDAYNLYEVSRFRKQPLSFTNPDSSLEVIGPIDGLVFGTLASRPGEDPAVWVFEAVNPMRPRCDESPGVL